VSRKSQREQEREDLKARRKAKLEAATSTELNVGQKRKRSEVDESDPKLKEFLEVMKPPSKTKAWATQTDEEPPTTIHAVDIPEAESDGEYETVPKKSRKQSSAEPSAQVKPLSEPIEFVEPMDVDDIIQPEIVPDATDDDWMRSRTNRLLDLMDPEDIGTAQGGIPQPNNEPLAEVSTNNDNKDDEMRTAKEGIAEIDEEEKPDPVIEAIKFNGRLFVRNLPYSASEEDLRLHFSPYGTLEDVCTCSNSRLSFLLLYDEYPDRDSLCFKHVM